MPDALNFARAVKLSVNVVNDIFGIPFGFRQMTCDALDVTTITAIKIPPSGFISGRAGEREEKIGGLNFTDETLYVVNRRIARGEIFIRRDIQRSGEVLCGDVIIGRGLGAARVERVNVGGAFVPCALKRGRVRRGHKAGAIIK